MAEAVGAWTEPDSPGVWQVAGPHLVSRSLRLAKEDETNTLPEKRARWTAMPTSTNVE